MKCFPMDHELHCGVGQLVVGHVKGGGGGVMLTSVPISAKN